MKGFDTTVLGRCPLHGCYVGRCCPLCGDAEPPNRTYAEKRHENRPDRQLPNPKPERHDAAALGGTVPGEEKGMEGACGRTRVRFTGYRVKMLDPDNFAASTKALVDGLRHCGILEGDEPWRIILETDQVRVKSFKEERTVITIETP